MLISASKSTGDCSYKSSINNAWKGGSLQLKRISKSFSYMALII